MDPKTLKELVGKITAARKVQKQRIDASNLAETMQTEDIEKVQKPVVSVLRQQIEQQEQQHEAQQQQARQHQLEQIQHLQELQQQGQQHQLEQIQHLQRLLQPPAPQEPEHVVQKLLTEHRNDKNVLTRNEVNLYKGTLGEHGKVDKTTLMNEDRLILSVGNRLMKTVEPKHMTKGLAALLLLPWDDIQKSGIDVTEEDKLEYYEIMKIAGINPSSRSLKYRRIVKPYEDLESLESDDPDAFATPKAGRGVFVYRNPAELVDRMSLLTGSIRA